MVPVIPREVSTACLSAGVFAAAIIVETGVTTMALAGELGRSDISAMPNNCLPVLVSVPPMEITLRFRLLEPEIAGTLKNPAVSVRVVNSSAPGVRSPSASIKTLAPDKGPSTTLPSAASVTVTVTA